MAASGFTPISLYYSTTASAVPSSGNLVNGELALNTADMKLYAKNSAGTVTLLASSGGATGTVSSVAATVPSFLSITGSPITTSGTLAISLSGSALPTTSGGTGLTSFNANGVVYASSSSALATSSALTWDGSLFTVTHASGVDGRGIRLVNSSNSQTWETRIGVQALENTSYAIKDITAGAVSFLIQASTGNVGIGTTDPASFSSKLVVVGTISASAGNYLRVWDPTNTTYVQANSPSNREIRWVNDATTEYFRFGSAGQFGIGGANYGLAGQVLTSSGSSSAPTWASAGGGSGFTAKTANYTAVSGDNILANTSGGSWTLTLPASPSTGNSVQVMDSNGTFDTFPLTVARNGQTIMGAAENMTLSLEGVATTFVYNGSTWRVI